MRKINIVCLGDCLFEDKFVYSSQFDIMMNYLKKFDLININLETVVSNIEGEKAEKAYSFKTKKENILKVIDILENKVIFNIANNHIMDYGENCLNDMVQFLASNNIDYVGVIDKNNKKYIKYKNINGFKFSILGAYKNYYNNSEINIVNIDKQLISKIKLAKENSDFLILNLHWGEEESLCPSPNQIIDAHIYIENGVDFLIGHHPHVIQGNEIINNRFIEYSLGNFQIKTLPEFIYESYGKIVEYEIYEDRRIEKKYKYIYIENSLPNFIDNKNENIRKIEKKCEENLQFNSWKRFYKESSTTYFLNAFDAWRRRINEKEKYIYFKILRWILRKNTFKMGYFYILKNLENLK